MSDKPDFIVSDSPGFNTSREGYHFETSYYDGLIPLGSAEIFAWYPFWSIRLTVINPVPPLAANVRWYWSPLFAGGAGFWDADSGNFNNTITVPYMPPRYWAGWFMSLSGEDVQVNNFNAFNVTIREEFLLPNGDVYRTIDRVWPAGLTTIVGNFIDFSGVTSSDMWGPDSIHIETDAKGPQQYCVFYVDPITFLNVYLLNTMFEGYSSFNFMHSSLIGFPSIGCIEEIWNSNGVDRTFKRTFNHAWSEDSL